MLIFGTVAHVRPLDAVEEQGELKKDDVSMLTDWVDDPAR